MSQTDAQVRAVQKYHSKFDDIKIRVPKGDRQILQEYAAARGESLTVFIRRAIAETMERDQQSAE